MKLAETLVPLLPLTPPGFITLKADHPRRVWELDETYHAAQQTAFRDTTWEQRCVKKFSNLLSLTEWGVYGHLEEGGVLYLNMDV